MIKQGSSEWFRMKAGKFSASNMGKLTAGGKGITRKKYLYKIACERISGEYIHTHQTSDMERGNELESVARQAYQELTMEPVETAEFVIHPDIPYAGASPDGYVGDDGLIEIKTRAYHIQLDFILGKQGISGANMKQMQFQMACTGRDWCDYVSYSSEVPKNQKICIVRVKRSDEEIKQLEGAVRRANDEVEEIVKALKEESCKLQQ